MSEASVSDGDGPPPPTRVRLAHACVQWLADRADSRIMHIKGHALDAASRSQRGGGTDVDVLVAPQDQSAFEEQLRAGGWELITSFRSGSFFGHAATYYHPVWGTTDLHRWIPGLERDPHVTFEALWQTRQPRELGGAECAVPSDHHHRLILLLHAVRNGALGGVDYRLGWGQLDGPLRSAVRHAAYALGAHVPFLLATTEAEHVPGRSAHLWSTMMRGRPTTEQWAARFKDVESMRQLVDLIHDAVVANREHLQLELGRQVVASDMVREQLRRAGAAARWVFGLGGLSRRPGLGSRGVRGTDRSHSS
nr:nucleotidyltransferase family protein [Brevibacterium senegalense]